MATHALVETRFPPFGLKAPEWPLVKVPLRIRILGVLIWGIAGGIIPGTVIWILPGIIQTAPGNIIQASGRIEGREVTLAAKEIQGRVKNLFVDEGYKVKKGQLLAELESQQLDARFETVASNVANVDAQFRQGLIDAMAEASKDTVSLKKQHLRGLQQARRAALAQLAEARANIEERKIYAPVDGTILSRTAEVGDVVNPGSPIFVMADMSRMYLRVYVPEPDIPKLELGDPADITVDTLPGRTFPARITKIYDQAEFTPENVKTKQERVKPVFGIELTFVPPDPALKPGMPVDCIIHVRMVK